VRLQGKVTHTHTHTYTQTHTVSRPLLCQRSFGLTLLDKWFDENPHTFERATPRSGRRRTQTHTYMYTRAERERERERESERESERKTCCGGGVWRSRSAVSGFPAFCHSAAFVRKKRHDGEFLLIRDLIHDSGYGFTNCDGSAQSLRWGNPEYPPGFMLRHMRIPAPGHPSVAAPV